MDYAAIIAAAASVVGGLLGAGKDAEAQRIRDQMAAQYGPDILPHLDKAVAEQAGPSALTQSQVPQQGRETQLDLDQELKSIYDNAGTTPQDEAAYTLAKRKVNEQAAAQAGDVALSAARRGQGASPLAAVLASQVGQDSLESLAGMDAQQASDSRQRAMQALMGRASNANAMRGQDWQQFEGINSAADLMNRFNASQRQQVGLRNADLSQQAYQDNLQRLAGLQAAETGQAQGLNQQGQTYRQAAAGVGNAALSYGSGWDDTDPNKKKKGG